MYTLGNITALCATLFLFGPYTQLKKMFQANRFISTSIYLSMMGITLFIAFYPKYIPLRIMWLVFSVFIQFLALGKNFKFK